ncbi:MAG TPA: type VI secretion system baseplate subunit TssK [Thermoanaerobaculia bacterium]|nr:type VI secretion system baseplate subunit TssK [Thermoanaerobaculia bacterium]
MNGDGPVRRKGREVATASDVPAAIQWHEGMLLAPQHFQWLSRRQDALLHYHLSAASPFHWGVRHLRIDEARLSEGTFRVLALEAVMPDGLIVSYMQGELPDLSVDLPAKGDATVQVAVARRGRGLALRERFDFADGGNALDENDDEGEVPVPVLKPRLKLLTDAEAPTKYVTFPLAKVAYVDNVHKLETYEPPCLEVIPGTGVYDLCERIATELRRKAEPLVEASRAPSSAGSAPLETRAMVHALVGALPPFEAALRSRACHPFPLYLALCGVLGHVSGLSDALVPPVLDPYDHDDLLASFKRVRTAIDQAVKEGILERFEPHRFEYKDGAFQLQFDPGWAQRSLYIGVRAPSGVSDREMEAWVAASLIASESKVLDLWGRRVVGSRRERVEAIPGLTPSRGVSLYLLSADREYVVPDESLKIRNLDDREGRRRPDSIVLYVEKDVKRDVPA